MPNNNIQTAGNGDVGDLQTDTPVSQTLQLLNLHKRVEALESITAARLARIELLAARLSDVLSIAAAAYDTGQRSAQPTAKASRPDTPLALRHACAGEGPAVDVKVIAPSGTPHFPRVTPGVTNADAVWANVLRRDSAEEAQ